MRALPRILCGPILRRCDDGLVTVWIATSEELPPKAGIRILEASGKSAIRIPTKSEKRTVRVGRNLWVSLLMARPAHGRFSRGKLLAYDLDLGQGPLTIRDLDFRDLVYHKRPTDESSTHGRPTFFLQPEGEPIRIMQGSCRKPYGMGADTLAAADTLIARNPVNVKTIVSEEEGVDKGRPAVLFLTGDQIYADDVEKMHFAMLRDLSIEVMGSDESLPLESTRFMKLKELTYGETRKQFTLRTVGFTTEDGEGHLLGLGEYAAMYLMVWSQTVWDRAAVAELPSEPWRPSTPTGEDPRRPASRVRDMYTTLPAVRRALANTPTYMIFDDHDVTDDWNVNAEWYQRVSENVTGRRVVANALAAYWLFQAWGNEPDHFPPAFVETIQAYCDHKRQLQYRDIDPRSEVASKFVELLWNYHEWSFVAPVEPVTVFADMRTERELFREPTAPMLINQSGLKKVAKLAADAGHRANSPLIMISSAPVWNISGLEMGQVIGKKVLRKDIVDVDWEQWSNNQIKKGEFLRFILERMNPSFCVFLSGEVHFGVTAGVDCYLDPPFLDVLRGKKITLPAKQCGRFVQLTASALKNENKTAASFFVKNSVFNRIPGVDMNEEDWTLIGTPYGIKDFVRGEAPEMRAIHWVEVGRNFRDPRVSEAYAPVMARCNLGVVTVDLEGDRVVHEFCVIEKLQQFAPPIREGFTAVPTARSTSFDAGKL